ncbi:MAG: multicopper oxidase domain-containing protein [Gammaproteobacteria bacterium]|nr:multicopper oxidase domain-containing protein [Gammaproteobacteria bacterium]
MADLIRKQNAECKQGDDGDCGLNPQEPPTPYEIKPDVYFEREVVMDITQTYLSGGAEHDIDFWGFIDPLNGGHKSVPSPAMRVTQGQTVHTHLDSSHIHTIHHHGIEPTSFNDGVGHYSFDVQGKYNYQWYASQSGTYMYHCHTNTVLHVEMGMYGGLIIDPPTGPGTVEGAGIGNYLPYDVEAIWAVDEIDSTWRCHAEDAALCGGDAGLNYFDPDFFIINGISDGGTIIKNADGDDETLRTATAAAVAIKAKVDDRVLVRYIHGGYFPHHLVFPAAVGKVWTIAEDGRPLAVAEEVPSGGTIVTPGERREFYFTPQKPGQYQVTIEMQHWITRKVVGSVSTLITVD